MYDVYFICLGLQFNWSEHRPVKAEAAGSSPVSPDGSKSNKKKHQYISPFLLNWGKIKWQNFMPTALLCSFFFFISISHQLVPIDEKETCANCYNYWQHHIQDSKSYRRESGFFDCPPSVYGMESSTISFPGAYTQLNLRSLL